MVVYIIVVNLLLAFKLWHDKMLKSKGRIVNHALNAVIDTLIYTSAACIIFGANLLSLGVVIATLGYRWLMFDLLFNLYNGWKWNHDGTSSKLDVKFAWMKGWDLLLKFGIILIGIIIIVWSIYYQKEV